MIKIDQKFDHDLRAKITDSAGFCPNDATRKLLKSVERAEKIRSRRYAEVQAEVQKEIRPRWGILHRLNRAKYECTLPGSKIRVTLESLSDREWHLAGVRLAAPDESNRPKFLIAA